MIVFNYDRCIEFYLYWALKNYYKLKDDAAALLVQNLVIYRPYGTVGTLPWPGNGEPVMYGMRPAGQALVKAAARIRTFTEGTDPASSEITAIRELMAGASRLVFLGFAFHRMNLKLLLPATVGLPHGAHREIFATTLGISTHDSGLIGTELKTLFGSNITLRLHKGTCADLFDEYWRALSFV